MSTHSTEQSTIETDLSMAPRPLPNDMDPVAAALRTLGFNSISTGLRTAQVDGLLYDLDTAAQAAIAHWLDGDWLPSGKVRLLRRQLGRTA